MGVYDTVLVKCPVCEKENQFQSKSGDCLLENYNLENCPDDVLLNVNRHSPIKCECGTLYEVDINNRKAVVSFQSKSNLMEGLLSEINRAKDIKKMYDEIPQGKFGSTMIQQSIERAEKSITENNVVAMLLAYRDLQEIE